METAITEGFADIVTLLTTTIVPAVFGLTVAAVGVAYGVKWLRRAAK